MSSMNPQILQAKIESRQSAVKNLDLVLARENASRRLLQDQISDHEVAMAERVELGTDHVRWTTWAETRLAGMQLQLEEAEQRIEKILGTIVGHEAAIKSFKAELEGSTGRPAFVFVSKAPSEEKPSKLLKKTVMDLERKPPQKNPGRKYLPKKPKKSAAEREVERKAAAQAKKASKDAKASKADKKAKKQAARAA